MDKKVKIALTVAVSLFLLLVSAGIVYRIWANFQVGTLTVNSDSEVIFYEIKETGNTYVGNQTIPNLKKGFYTVHAYGILENLYYPKNFEVEIKGNKTTSLKIELEKTPTNADVSGVEGP